MTTATSAMASAVSPFVVGSSSLPAMGGGDPSGSPALLLRPVQSARRGLPTLRPRPAVLLAVVRGDAETRVGARGGVPLPEKPQRAASTCCPSAPLAPAPSRESDASRIDSAGRPGHTAPSSGQHRVIETERCAPTASSQAQRCDAVPLLRSAVRPVAAPPARRHRTEEDATR